MSYSNNGQLVQDIRNIGETNLDEITQNRIDLSKDSADGFDNDFKTKMEASRLRIYSLKKSFEKMSSSLNNSNNIEFVHSNENVNFGCYLDKFRNDEITWKILFEKMKDYISKDSSKSNELNYVLLNELKVLKEREAENKILKNKNASLLEENNKLQAKINSHAIFIQGPL